MDAKKHLDKVKIVLRDGKNGREYELGIAGYEFDGPMEDKEGTTRLA